MSGFEFKDTGRRFHCPLFLAAVIQRQWVTGSLQSQLSNPVGPQAGLHRLIGLPLDVCLPSLLRKRSPAEVAHGGVRAVSDVDACSIHVARPFMRSVIHDCTALSGHAAVRWPTFTDRGKMPLRICS